MKKAQKEQDNIIKINRGFHMNIGVLIFGFILIYTLYFVFKYVTTDHILAYEVTEGSIVQNTTYTGVALREEKIYYAQTNGIVDYYINAGERVSVRSLIYSIDRTDTMSQYLSAHEEELNTLTSENLAGLRKVFENYTSNYSDVTFGSVYDLKNEASEKLNENKNQKALSLLSASGDATLNMTFAYGTEPGIVEFYTDGYENVSPDSVNSFLFNQTSYIRNDLTNGSTIGTGGVAYKLISNEEWDLIIPISSTMATRLANQETVDVLFTKDNTTETATVSLLYKADGTYADLHFTTAMVRFAGERFLDVKLELDNVTGLKIPISSITTKTFYLIPKEFLTTGGDSSESGFLVSVVGEDGNSTTKFESTTLYFEKDDCYYIADENIPAGTTILKPNSKDKFFVRDSATLQGVYNINKGYAVFKQIEILHQNEEYAIIKRGTDYGLAQYDYIAIDSSFIYEGQIVQ